MAPVTRAYTDFLLRAAATGDFCELAAALLPCMWGFSEIGTAGSSGMPEEPRCAAWIDAYADEDFAQQASWCRSWSTAWPRTRAPPSATACGSLLRLEPL